MKEWRKKRIRAAWGLAWALAVFLHRLLIPLLGGEDFDLVALLIGAAFFGLISFAITWMFFLFPPWLIAIGLFAFGVLMELFIYQVILNPILAGLFYVVLFFVPYWIAKRYYASQKPAQAEPE